MPPAKDQQQDTAKLPTHAAFTSQKNLINLSYSSRSSRLAFITSSSWSAAKRREGGVGSTHGSTPLGKTLQDRAKEEDEDLAEGLGPSEGIGYVADKKQASARDVKREDEILRRKFLGKRGRGEEGMAKSSKRVESSEDEEGGRSALGKAKKKRKGNVAVEEGDGEVASDAGSDQKVDGNNVNNSTAFETVLTGDTRVNRVPSGTKKPKKKKKNDRGSTG